MRQRLSVCVVVAAAALTAVSVAGQASAVDHGCKRTGALGQCEVTLPVGGGGGGNNAGGGGGGGGNGNGNAAYKPPSALQIKQQQAICAAILTGTGKVPDQCKPNTATSEAQPVAFDAGEIAEALLAQVNFRAIEIGIVPENKPDRVGLIGLPTWMWVADPSPATVGPIRKSVSAAGFTVRLTAQLSHITWDMGDGTKVTCGVGTPYADHFGKQSSPTCGHRYQRTSADQPGKAYTVTASSYWDVTWSATGGQGGQLQAPPLVRTTQIRIGELQVLNQ